MHGLLGHPESRCDPGPAGTGLTRTHNLVVLLALQGGERLGHATEGRQWFFRTLVVGDHDSVHGVNIR